MDGNSIANSGDFLKSFPSTRFSVLRLTSVSLPGAVQAQSNVNVSSLVSFQCETKLRLRTPTTEKILTKFFLPFFFEGHYRCVLSASPRNHFVSAFSINLRIYFSLLEGSEILHADTVHDQHFNDESIERSFPNLKIARIL